MERRQYSSTAKVLHWTMAVVIICSWAVGYYSSTLTVPQKIQADSIMLHKSVATVTLFLVAARIAWRLVHGAPQPSSDLPVYERRASLLGHAALYLCMVALPMSGWLWSSAAGYPIPVAKLFFLPPLMAKTPELAPLFKQTHIVLAYTIAFLVVGHVLMALKHHFIDRNDSLRSMLPSWLLKDKKQDEQRSISA